MYMVLVDEEEDEDVAAIVEGATTVEEATIVEEATTVEGATTVEEVMDEVMAEEVALIEVVDVIAEEETIVEVLSSRGSCFTNSSSSSSSSSMGIRFMVFVTVATDVVVFLNT